MKKHLTLILGSCILVLTMLTNTLGQANKTILYGEAALLRGVGKYNVIGISGGANVRLQYPILPNLALTARAGVEYITISYAGAVAGFTSLGYNYNINSGWGFNTVNYVPGLPYDIKQYGINIPVTIGPRLYLPALLEGLHTDFNAGVDIAATSTLITSLHLSPAVGYTMPLPNGRFLDITAGFVTNLERGNGMVSIGVAYGLPVSF